MDGIALNIQDCSVHPLQTVFCSPDHLVLEGFAHFHPISRKTGHPDYQVTVILGVQLGIDKHPGIDHIKLKLKTRFLEIGFDECQ